MSASVDTVAVQQSSLRVGAVNDPAEVEAEAVAERVMQMPERGPALLQRCPGGCPNEEVVRRQPLEEEEYELQRQPIDDEEELQLSAADSGPSGIDSATAEAIGARRRGGSPLSSSSRRFFEPRFGVDLSGIRVHHDGEAAGLAKSVNARAFTVGKDVFFGSAEWAPGTARGDRLLAHELTHTRQNGMAEIRRATPRPDQRPIGSTNYRFDTFRATASDLLDEEMLVRFNDLELPHLTLYLNSVADQAVRSFIVDIISARNAEENAVGRRIVSIYLGLPDKLKTPGGACFTVARGRVERAAREITGVSLTDDLDVEDALTFDRIWGSLISPRGTWLDIPGNVRGKGAPGAMVFAGTGMFVDEEAMWAGELQPGAVIQTWDLEADVAKVGAGDTPDSYGHSFIFLRYKRMGDVADGAIEGIEIADQGFQSGGVLKRDEYGWWLGANITIRGERKFVRPWSLVEPGMQQ